MSGKGDKFKTILGDEKIISSVEELVELQLRQTEKILIEAGLTIENAREWQSCQYIHSDNRIEYKYKGKLMVTIFEPSIKQDFNTSTQSMYYKLCTNVIKHYLECDK